MMQILCTAAVCASVVIVAAQLVHKERHEQHVYPLQGGSRTAASTLAATMTYRIKRWPNPPLTKNVLYGRRTRYMQALELKSFSEAQKMTHIEQH